MTMSEQLPLPFRRSRNKLIDMAGWRVGRLTVQHRVEAATHRRKALWLCLCDCGNTKVISARHLRGRWITKSCGCAIYDQKPKKHGFATHKYAGHPSGRIPEYKIWCSMRRRCRDVKDKRWNDYGGRGIKVCAEWDASFPAFLRDMGYRPSEKHSLDRIDVNGNYCPGNVRWATMSVQNCNKRPMKALGNFSDDELLAEVDRRGLDKPCQTTIKHSHLIQ